MNEVAVNRVQKSEEYNTMRTPDKGNPFLFL
jgi:hypothetical protein